jgi:hypothetical protein
MKLLTVHTWHISDMTSLRVNGRFRKKTDFGWTVGMTLSGREANREPGQQQGDA